MRKHINLVGVAVLCMVMLLAACNGSDNGEEYPGPGQIPPPEGAYPPAGAQPASPGLGGPGSADVLYPNLNDGDVIYWSQAEAMILNGEVAKIVQTHSLEVRISLKDGRSFITKEPEIDYVLRVVERCGDICEDVLIATE